MLRHYIKRAANVAVQFVFARRQFKLLLRTTLGALDERMQALSAATSFFSKSVEPIVMRPPFGTSMLVVAPHQDDEVIGCGGAMALQRQSGGALKVVVLQDGADEHSSTALGRDALREKRNAESRAAARVIDAEEPIFFGERNLRARMATISARLAEVIDERRIDVLFTPFVLDGHEDHRTCNLIVAEALEKCRRSVRLWQYEVWGNCIPTVVVVIDEVIGVKLKMLSCFEFANGAVDYANATIGLNMFNSRLLPAGRAKYVEAFFESPLQEFLDMVNAVEIGKAGTGGGGARSGVACDDRQS